MKVLIDGYFYRNAGDDLFLKTILDELNNDKMQFYVIGDKNNLEYFKQNYKIKIVSLKKAMLLSPKIDIYINVGGSIFIEKEGWWKLFVKRLYFFGVQKLKSKPGYIIGANFGPYKTKKFLKMYKWFINVFVTKMTVRDNYSSDILNSNKIEVFEDLVFSMKDFRIKKNPYTSFNKSQEVVGYSLIHPVTKKESKTNMENYLIDITNKIKNDIYNNKKVKLFSFCELEGDLDFINDMLSNFTEIEVHNIEVINYNGDLDKFLNEFMNIDVLIGARFHSIILAIKLGIPFVPIVYSEKTFNYLKKVAELRSSSFYSLYEPNSKALYTRDYISIDVDQLTKMKVDSKGHLEQILVGDS